MCKQFSCPICGEVIYSSGERVGECEHYTDEQSISFQQCDPTIFYREIAQHPERLIKCK